MEDNYLNSLKGIKKKLAKLKPESLKICSDIIKGFNKKKPEQLNEDTIKQIISELAYNLFAPQITLYESHYVYRGRKCQDDQCEKGFFYTNTSKLKHKPTLQDTDLGGTSDINITRKLLTILKQKQGGKYVILSI